MKKQNLLNSYSLTEKVLILISVTLITAIFISATTGSGSWLGKVSAQEGSETSEDDETSSSNDDSEDSVDEVSVSDDDETSVNGEPSVDEMSIDETSEVSVQETDEVSVQETDEISVDEQEESVQSLDDFEVVEVLSGGEMLVSREERLFFLIPVSIESVVTVDDSGNVITISQSLWSRILSLLSF